MEQKYVLKTIDSDELKYYNSIADIPEDDYEYVWFLCCSHNNLTNIDFINKLPNLKELDASNNIITRMPIHDSIEYLDMHNNKLQVFPSLLNLIEVDISNNNINEIFCSPNITLLNISNNCMRLLYIFSTLKYLYCDNNQINKIYICNNNQLEELECHYNNLCDINFVFYLRYLKYFKYNNNYIKYIPPHIVRKFHSSEIILKSRHSMNMEQIKKIHFIMNKVPFIYSVVITQINKSYILQNKTKKLLKLYCESDEINYKIRVTFKEMLCAIWTMIHNNPRIIFKLNESFCAPLKCRCLSCKLITLSNIWV